MYSPDKELTREEARVMRYEMMANIRAYIDKKLAEQEAKNQAILASWKAGKERDQVLITKIKTEAASRDQLRLDQLEEEKRRKKEEKSRKKEEKAELARLRNEMRRASRRAAREIAKIEKIYRKDTSERNGVHVCCSSRS